MGEGAMPAAAVAGAVAAAKALLRTDGAGEEALLATMAGSALLLAEAFVGQRLVVRGFADTMAGDGGWQRLASEPVTAVTGGVEALAFDIDAHGVGWVRVPAGVRATVAYEAGLAATWEALPPTIAQSVALLAAHLFEHREGDAAPPAAIAALWRPWRRLRVGSARR